MQRIINVWNGLPKATMKQATVSIFKEEPDKEEKNSMIQTLDRQVDGLDTPYGLLLSWNVLWDCILQNPFKNQVDF